MGNTASEEHLTEETQNLKGKKSGKRKYKVPEVRERDRFEPLVNSNSTNAFEASIDKYDYLIVFPKTEGPFVHFSTKEAKRKLSESDSQFIKWDTIKELWKQSVPGTDVNKDAAVDALATYWKKRTGSFPQEAQEIRVIPWLTIAREAIIDQLSTKSGLQLKLTANGSHIFCRVRAPIKLLEQQADKMNYRLQLKGEIDPGSDEFWNVIIRGKAVELEEERKLYTKEKANEILQNLYRAGKISPGDLGVDESKETQVVWSRRVHALERIADQVPVHNKFLAYIPFTTNKHLRYLYQAYPSVRGKTLFKAKDRLYLTKAIIDSFFDCDVLSDRSRGTLPVISDVLALHDANRGESITSDLLQRRWVSFWRISAKEAGSPFVSHSSYDSDEGVDWYLRPFSLPLSDIRDYFGESIGLHYAWYSFYIFALLIPATLGIIMEIIYSSRGYYETTGSYDTPTFVILLLVILWGTLYHGSWDVEEAIVALKWGTSNLQSDASLDRPQFRPDPQQPTIRSKVNNQTVTNFPQEKRRQRTVLTLVALFLAIVFDAALIAMIFGLDIFVLRTSSSKASIWITFFLQAFAIKLASFLFKPWSKFLTDFENHRTETAFEENLVFKIVVFESFNSYAALLYTAFVKGYVFDGCAEDSCISDLRGLLIAIIVVRVSFNIIDLFLPPLRKAWNDYNQSQQKKSTKESDALLSAAQTDDVDENTDYMQELNRGYYDGSFDDYSYAVFQYGYLMLFMSALPALGIITILENMIKMRTDGFKLCSFVRRPNVLLDDTVGTWKILMEGMSYLGIVTTVAILVFTTSDFDNYSIYQKAIIFLVTQQVIILAKMLLRSIISGTPESVQEIAQRHEYIEDKFLKGYEDENPGTFDLSLAQTKGVLDDSIDVDGLNLYDLRKGQQISEEDYREIEKLETRRRDLNRELRYAKDKLLEVYKSETYNENTGVGETKHGLPLGRLSVKVLEIQGLPVDGEFITADQAVKVRMNIKGTRKGLTNIAPPLGPLNDTSVYRLIEGGIAINQSLGPFAPIRTQDAEIVFDVLDMSPKNSEASLATCSVKLRELQDQLSHDSVLNLIIRSNVAALKAADAKLFVTLKFEYSKVVPLRNKIYGVQDKLRQVEKRLAILKSGRKPEDESEV